MQAEFVGRSMEVSARFRRHAEPRLKRIARLLDDAAGVRVSIGHLRGQHTVELTVTWRTLVLRSEVRDSDELGAFDRALEKLERQAVRYKGKLREYSRDAVRKPPAAEEETEPAEEETPEVEETPGEIRIVRTKTHALKPMTPEEAVLQMELVGHSFYVFKDGQSDTVGVVYKRDEGDYGLIEYEN